LGVLFCFFFCLGGGLLDVVGRGMVGGGGGDIHPKLETNEFVFK